MTKNTMGALNALTYAPKLYAFERGLDPQSYNSIGAQLRSYARMANSLSDIEPTILGEFATNQDALTIFQYAKMMEGLITSYGQHAAGVIVIMDHKIEDYIPLMAPNKDEEDSKFAIQADMINAEAVLGFIKFDFLGLKNLNVINKCVKDIEAHYGVSINPYDIDLTDPKVINMFAEGDTNFVFQLESDGMKGMLRGLKPTRFEDLILAVSVYRPGPMDFIPDIIASKNEGKVSEFIQLAPALEPILKETYGYPVYQEQVMQITEIVAGFSKGKADEVRRAMSKKNKEALEKMLPEFIDGAKANGYSEEIAQTLWDKLQPFAKYGFNKSHAATYSLISYITAYLKTYYPEEYLCAVMTEQSDKIAQFISDCKKYKIEILQPDINKSMSDFNVETKGAVRFGISAIKGLKSIGQTITDERESHGAFSSLTDALDRLSLKSNEWKALCLSGVFDSFTSNREETLRFIYEYTAARAEVNRCEEKLMEFASENIESEADAKSQNKNVKEWTAKLNVANSVLENVSFFDTYPTPNNDKVMYEVEYLGTWVSLSPLDDYQIPDEATIHHATEVTNEELEKNVNNGAPNVSITGVVTNYNEFLTKKSEAMAAFTLIDKNGDSLSCVCFPSNFDGDRGNCKNVLSDNAILTVTGKIGEHNDEAQMVVNNCRKAKVFVEELLLTLDPVEAAKLYEQIAPYKTVGNGVTISVANPDQFTEQLKGFGNYTEEVLDTLRELDIEFDDNL